MVSTNYLGGKFLQASLIVTSVLGGSKTTLRFDALLEGFPRLRNAVILMVVIYYRQRLWIKINMGPNAMWVKSKRN